MLLFVPRLQFTLGIMILNDIISRFLDGRQITILSLYVVAEDKKMGWNDDKKNQYLTAKPNHTFECYYDTCFECSQRILLCFYPLLEITYIEMVLYHRRISHGIMLIYHHFICVLV
jgi:hypothetical protein